MARTDNLTNFLTDVAIAIKTKKGDETPILASNFDTEITNLQSGGGVDIDDYFNTTCETTSSYWVDDNFLKKIPDVYVSDTVTSLERFACYADLAPKIICNDNVMNTRYMYANNTATKIDSTGINMSKVTDMQSMYQYCTFLQELNLENIDTGSTTNMEGVFQGCSLLLNIKGIENLNTSLVTNMRYMFSSCSKLTNLDLSNWDVSEVGSMQQMFCSCSGLITLNISGWVPVSYCSKRYTFQSCSKLEKLIIDTPTLFTIDSTSFTGSSIANGTGYVYVPDDMVETYKSDTNWSAYANQIKGMSELV